jgi:hypothetical protein
MVRPPENFKSILARAENDTVRYTRRDKERLIRTLSFPSLRFVLYRSHTFRIEIDFRGFDTSSAQPQPFTFERD